MQPIVSEYADAPELVPLIIDFASELPKGVRAMLEALSSGRFDELQSLAHKLSGTGGTYGYPMVSTAAEHLESRAEAKDAEGASEALKRLDTICQAIVEGLPDGVHWTFASSGRKT